MIWLTRLFVCQWMGGGHRRSIRTDRPSPKQKQNTHPGKRVCLSVSGWGPDGRTKPSPPKNKTRTEADGDEEVDGEARGPGVVLGEEAGKGLDGVVIGWLRWTKALMG